MKRPLSPLARAWQLAAIGPTIWARDRTNTNGTGGWLQFTRPADALEAMRSAESISFLGAPANASLIWAFTAYDVASMRTPRIWIASAVGWPPSQPAAESSLTTAGRVFTGMDALLNRPSACGGYHLAGGYDLAVYRNLSLVQSEDVSAVSQFSGGTATTSCHPAWPALGFLPRCELGVAARWLADMIDPRWFVNLDKPDSLAPLRNFMGMDPAVFGSSRGQNTARAARARSVLATWTGVGSVAEIDLAEIRGLASIPAGFLQRCFLKHSRPEIGALRASSLLLAYVCGVWRQLVALTPGEDVFVPSYFFESDACEYAEDCARSFTARLNHILGQPAD